MKREELLLKRLISYSQTDAYPFHMPGHKRQMEFPNPYQIDITEIDGFDNLHHAEGILKESMEWAASVYHADQTYYLVNGSSGGILSSIFAATKHGGKLLVSRNCHKSVYHGVILNYLDVRYVYPQIISDLGIQGGIMAADVEKALEEDPDIEAVLIVSPTYDGVVSDIQAIAEVIHRYHIPLIVDEAHGAHFSFGSAFPESALMCGADLVVQSLHKTLSAFTQTAVLHMRHGYIAQERLERYLQMFQSSSPSYVFLAGIEACIFDMEEHGVETMALFQKRLNDIRGKLSGLKHLKLAGRELCGCYGVFDVDESKIVVSICGCGIKQGDTMVKLNGEMLGDWLRQDYHLEMEMCGANYVVAITTWKDTMDGFNRLADALLEIDDQLIEMEVNHYQVEPMEVQSSRVIMAEAMDSEWEALLLEECIGKISAEFVYLYPPGIPIITPGELVTKGIVDEIKRYVDIGLPVQGMVDQSLKYLRVIKR